LETQEAVQRLPSLVQIQARASKFHRAAAKFARRTPQGEGGLS